ncbi:hypothetical protein C0Q70_13634 [Pomacea canaliculata]|uniref:tRNA (32-2'-O)-methyltransferase regulator THADA n=1 Tax=Pomacea canaliculata TaxID=400727 RepID=A0A2T7NXQ4_POMCA|nr:hypothetical protein C0Q70_13634 [Pomacea canaliculata]
MQAKFPRPRCLKIRPLNYSWHTARPKWRKGRFHGKIRSLCDGFGTFRHPFEIPPTFSVCMLHAGCRREKELRTRGGSLEDCDGGVWVGQCLVAGYWAVLVILRVVTRYSSRKSRVSSTGVMNDDPTRRKEGCYYYSRAKLATAGQKPAFQHHLIYKCHSIADLPRLPPTRVSLHPLIARLLLLNLQLAEKAKVHQFLCQLMMVVFLAKAQFYFFQMFRMPDQSAVMMNSTMHSCHVTMQALNRLFQRHAPQQEEIMSLQSSAFRELISADLQILLHEPMMADCRCCCAINLVLLLSLSVPNLLVEVTCALFTCGDKNIELPPWLQGIDLLQINMAKLSSMAALCMLWGLISMLPSEIMVLEVDSQDETPLFEVILKKLLELDERCVSMSTQAQAVKTVTLWTTRMYCYLQTGQIKEREKFKMSGSGSVTRQLLNFVWTHWQDQLEIVRLNSRITFENCIKIHMLASTFDNPSSDPFLLSMLKQVLDVSWCNPSKFGVLGSLVQCMGSAPVLQAHANFPLTLVQQIQDQGFACQYLLPRILKCEKSVLKFLLCELAVSGKQDGRHSGGSLGALIICMRRARTGGLLAWPQCGLDSVSTFADRVRDALGSQDEQVRLDAFALLCENKKTTELISQLEFDHVQYFIPHNLNNQSPAFRQSVLSSLRKLFTRIIESYGALLRNKKPDTVQRKPWKDAAASYNSFLAWLEEYLFEQLYPGAAFARRMMSLSVLSLLLQEIQTSETVRDSYQLLRRVTLHHLHSLLECMTDTYEENKHEAFKLLLACTNKHRNLLTEEHCKELYSCAMNLATSTRPQDSSTAAYLFRFLLQQSCISSVIKGHKLELQNPACIKKLGVWLSASNIEVPTVLHQLQVLLSLLVDQVVIARHSLVVAAASRPMHPTLHSIRCILSTLDLGSVDERCRALWAEFIHCLLQTCFQVAEVVSPVVQNSSPEGNIPQEAILGPGLNFDVKIIAEVEDVQQTVSLMPEYLVVCSWRSIKEVSLLLGQLCLSLPVTQPGVNQGLLSLRQVEDIGFYFKKQLMESLHRGAFELAYAGFVMMCQMLWRSSWSQLQQLPKQWLRDVMAVVVAEDRSAALCATRRSAGIPFFLQAILATESPATGRLSFHQVMRQLLDVAFSSLTLHPSRTDTCVHALNILRALFRDTRLGEDVASYISEGLMAAVRGFKSQYWEIRNSATLLLSALITRMFGVKRNKDDSVISKRNSQTGRAFFYKYPALFQFLLTELETATQSAAKTGQLHLRPSLYPVLMVLGHLYPSTMEEDSTHLNLAAFVPHVIKCASSPVYKTRIMAARALQPLVNKEQMCKVLTTLLSYLPKCPEEKLRISQSHLHGVLLQVHHLLLLLPDVSGGLLHEACDVCLAGLGACSWLVTRENKCLLTRKVAMEVLNLVLSHAEVIKMSFSARDVDMFNTIKCLFLTTLRSEVKKASEYSLYTPSLPDFLSCMGLLAMKWLVLEVSSSMNEDDSESVILDLLNFDAYEVHISVFQVLLSVPDISQYTSDENLIDVFDSLLLKIDVQKRSDVKASVMKFCGSLLPYLLKKMQGSTERVRSLLCKLKDILMMWCQAEQPEELQLACAHILCSHASSLLLDKDRCLGTLVFDFWTMVVYLLQADDLEVKEVMASVTAEPSLSQREGGSHPEQALLEVVNAMFALHGHIYELHCVSTVLDWLHKLFARVRLCNYEDSTQRLFDKGELNSFQDEICFARIISRTVEAWSVQAHKEGLPEKLHAKNEACQLQTKNLAVDPEASKLALTALTDAISEITSNISRTKDISTRILYLETSLYNEQVQSLIHAAVVAHIIKSVFIIGRLRGCHPEVELAYELLLQRVKMCSDTIEVSNCLLKKVLEEI